MRITPAESFPRVWIVPTAVGVCECDLVLYDFFKNQFKIGSPFAFDERAGAVHQIAQPSLHKHAQLEPTAKLGENRIVFESFDHAQGDSVVIAQKRLESDWTGR